MLQLRNKTPYQVDRGILLDMQGAEHWVVVVKATFAIKNSEAILSEKQEPVCLADQYHGEPGLSSMKYENELVLNKPGTDIVLNGHAYAPRGRPVERVDVSARVAGLVKEISVYGDRYWRRSASGLGLATSTPAPFLKMPLLYERAFGGADLSSDNEKNHGIESRNPIGVGFGLSKEYLAGKPLPNLEDPNHQITNWTDRPTPAGFSLICKHWTPRRQYAGTCDQRWREERLPLVPLDFDERFWLGAHPDLIAVPHLRGGELVELRNLTPEGSLAFRLPRVTLGFQTRLAGKRINHRAKLGSVIIESDVPRVILVWQTAIPCHRKKFELKDTRVYEKARIERN